VIVNAAHAIGDVVDSKKGEKGTIVDLDVSEWRLGRDPYQRHRLGMTENVQKKIFDPFFTTKEVGKGTGQGLAISHTVIVDKHKGVIDVDSEVGVGTTFTIRLPLVDDPSPVVAKRETVVRELTSPVPA